MTSPVAFDRLLRADWSVNPRKRFAATAERRGDRWNIGVPIGTGAAESFLAALLPAPAEHVLAGFDFPLGVPRAWGERTGLQGFPALLDAIAAPPWDAMFAVCAEPEQIGIHRPFYPLRSEAGRRPGQLVSALGLASPDELLRDCERAGDGRRGGCALFWTLGGNQVGKAALSGWREVICPARLHQARLWPFDGDLPALSCKPGLVLAETYPADALLRLGISRPPKFSKRNRHARAALAPQIMPRVESLGIELTPEAGRLIECGFGSHSTGEDQFDALLGLFAMIVTLRDARPPTRIDRVWEGGILGR